MLPVNFCLDSYYYSTFKTTFVHVSRLRYKPSAVLAAITSLSEFSSAHDTNWLADYNGATSTVLRFQRATVFLLLGLKLKT